MVMSRQIVGAVVEVSVVNVLTLLLLNPNLFTSKEVVATIVASLINNASLVVKVAI